MTDGRRPTAATRQILLIVTGGIAAYKALELIRLLRAADFDVTAVMTEAARHFVTPLSLQALTERPVYGDMWSLTDEQRMGHIELSRAADLLVVAPATADFLARMAAGLGNDLASTLLLATDKPVMVAPAMNVRMWQHPATMANMATLRARGVLVVGPEVGAMACHEIGPGRLAEPADILAAIEAFFIPTASDLVSAALPSATGGFAPWTPTGVPPASQIGGEPICDAGGTPVGVEGAKPPAAGGNAADTGSLAAGTKPAPLAGRHVLVTAGPTHEAIDPVRYLANRSSGRQGFAIAEALAALGARVSLVSGPVALADPAGVTVRRVETAEEMLAACEAALPAEAAVFAAAVADWRVAAPSEAKIKKSAGAPTLRLVPNPDILATLSAAGPRRPRLTVGFAAETDDVLAQAAAKLVAKGCDWVVANDVRPQTGIMGGTENQVSVLDAAGREDWPRMDKREVARRLAARIAAALAGDAAGETAGSFSPVRT